MPKKSREFEAFDKTMDSLLRVSHSEIKAKIDAEKAAKKRRPKPSASDLASRAKKD